MIWTQLVEVLPVGLDVAIGRVDDRVYLHREALWGDDVLIEGLVGLLKCVEGLQTVKAVIVLFQGRYVLLIIILLIVQTNYFLFRHALPPIAVLLLLFIWLVALYLRGDFHCLRDRSVLADIRLTFFWTSGPFLLIFFFIVVAALVVTIDGQWIFLVPI